MQKQLMIGAATAALMMSTSAFADVFITATITKTKDYTFAETVDITKTVTATGSVVAIAEKFAEADALVNQANHGNQACTNCAEKQDYIVGGSISGNSGYTSVNQASGNMNNQANAVSVAIDSGEFGGGGGGTPPPPNQDPETVGFAEANGRAQQINGGLNGSTPGTIVEDGNIVNSVNILFRDAIITDSINSNVGLVHVNQAVGQMANQTNMLTMAFSLRQGGVALAEAALGQFNQANWVGESDGSISDGNGGTTGAGLGIHKTAQMSNSINGNTGIVGANQSAGNMANQANIVSFAAVMVP